MKLICASPSKSFDSLPPVASNIFWAPDGRGLQFVVLNQLVGNVWNQPENRAPPVQVTHFNTGQLFTFAWSKNGRRLAAARGKTTRDMVLITNFE